MKFKNLFLVLLPIMLALLSCSEENDYENQSDNSSEIEALKTEVYALAEEYGVSVTINEEAWEENLPTIDEIEEFLIKDKAWREELKNDTSLLSLSSIKMINDSDEIMFAPTKIKTRGEVVSIEPVSGSFSCDDWVEKGNKIYYVSADVDWLYGGRGKDNVEVNGKVEDMDATTENSTTTVENTTYAFNAAPSFTVSTFFLYESSSVIVPINFWVLIDYESSTGVATCSASIVNRI